MKRGADAHWLMERPPDREKKHSKSLIRTGCFDHPAAYGAFLAAREGEALIGQFFCALFFFAQRFKCEPHSISGVDSKRKDAEKLAENRKNKNDFCHKQGDML